MNRLILALNKTARYINLIGNDPKKSEYAEEVFSLLTEAYKPIGGLHGSGFSSPEDMVANIPFWKLVRKNDKIVAVSLYKDKGGRKGVAIATDGTEVGREALKAMKREDFSRAYGEVSGPSLGFIVKHLGMPFVKSFAIDPKKAQEISSDTLYPPVGNEQELKKFPQLNEFFYIRKIGQHDHIKIMLGTPGKSIF